MHVVREYYNNKKFIKNMSGKNKSHKKKKLISKLKFTDNK